jgi:hypothetical protein
MIDKYLAKTFDMRTYNCWDFTREAWLELTGKDIGHRTPPAISKESLRKTFSAGETEFVQLPNAQDPCIILLTSPVLIPHVGVYIRGNVLHMADTGPRYEPVQLASLLFATTRFYTC